MTPTRPDGSETVRPPPPALQLQGQPLTPGTARALEFGFLGIVLAIAVLAISGKSLWIDEALTAIKAKEPTLAGWWQAMVSERASDLQMPLYMLYLWGYEKLFGAGEWALRAANLPWFMAGLGVFIGVFPPGDRRRFIAGGLVACSPFAWYCLDEARPYAMQLGASLMLAGALGRLLRNGTPRGEVGSGAWFVFGLLLLCGTSLLGMVWAAASLAALVLLVPWSRLRRLWRQRRWLWLAAGGGLAAFAAYYLWTLKVGARASAAGSTGWGNICFVAYELLGFSGLGPGRLELRSAGLTVLPHYWAGLALHGAATALLFGAALLAWRRSGTRALNLVVVACSLPAAFILGTGLVAHFRVLGRHFTPCLPLLLLVLMTGWTALGSRRRAWARLVVLLYCASCIWSCLSLRTAARHQKDDYRAAAAEGKTALEHGAAVWWSAAEAGARYYGLPISSRNAAGHEALLLFNPSSAALAALREPDLIIVSKPDLYDGQGAIAGYIRQRDFRAARSFAAFTVWERRAP